MTDQTREPQGRAVEEEEDEEGVDFEDTKAKQAEFEQLAREEGFDKAAKDAARGKKPSNPPGSTQPPQ
jgi:hypothetical protein